MTLTTIRQMLKWPKNLTISSWERIYLQRRLNKSQQMMVTEANLLKMLKKKRKRIRRNRKRSHLERRKRKKICPTCYPKAGLKVPRSPRLAIRSAFRETKRESNRLA